MTCQQPLIMRAFFIHPRPSETAWSRPWDPNGVVAWWGQDQLFLTNLRSTTHWLTPSFSTKLGISPTSKHVVSFFYKYIYIYFQHKSQVFTNKQRILVPNKNSMNYARKCGKYDLVDLSVYTLESSEYSLI